MTQYLFLPSSSLTISHHSNGKQRSLTQPPVKVSRGESATPNLTEDKATSEERLCLPPVNSFTTSLIEENDGNLPTMPTGNGNKQDAQDGHASGDSVKLPAAVTTSSNEINDRSYLTTHTTSDFKEETQNHYSSSTSIKLPTIQGNGSLVAIKYDHENEATTKLRSSPSHKSVQKLTGGGKKSPVHSSSSERLPNTRGDVAKRTASQVKLHSQMKVTRHSTFKDTPLGYKPTSTSKQRGNNRGNNVVSHDINNDSPITVPEASQSIREQLCRNSPTATHGQSSSSTEQRTTEDPHSVASRSPDFSGHLHQQAQRYDKLNQVLALLQQAKDRRNLEGEGSEPGTPPVKMSELKAHIKTALDEAVRLRADTEALQHRMLNGVSYNTIMCTIEYFTKAHHKNTDIQLIKSGYRACQQGFVIGGYILQFTLRHSGCVSGL